MIHDERGLFPISNDYGKSQNGMALKIVKVQLLLTRGTDEVHIVLEAPTPFPNMGYDCCAKIMVQKGYGQTWLHLMGIKSYETIDCRAG